jgi:hypothetical protein
MAVGVEDTMAVHFSTITEGQRVAARTLESITRHAEGLPAVRRQELQPGDWILVTTSNSTYVICVLGDDRYSVTGGWFDKHGLSPLLTTIVGCTWGGSAIKLDIVAACGLRLEFGNRVVTSRIKEVQVYHSPEGRAH